MYWNEYKTKSENKNTLNKYRHFIKSNFVGVNRLFVFIYPKNDDSVKIVNENKKIIYQKVLSKTELLDT